MEWPLDIVALTLLAVAAISGRLSGTPITAAMVFVAVGLLVGPTLIGELIGAVVAALPSSRRPLDTFRVLGGGGAAARSFVPGANDR